MIYNSVMLLSNLKLHFLGQGTPNFNCYIFTNTMICYEMLQFCAKNTVCSISQRYPCAKESRVPFGCW